MNYWLMVLLWVLSLIVPKSLILLSVFTCFALILTKGVAILFNFSPSIFKLIAAYQVTTLHKFLLSTIILFTINPSIFFIKKSHHHGVEYAFFHLLK